MNKSKGYRYFVWFFRIFLLAFVLAPLLWGMRTSFSLTNYDPRIIPKEVTIQNYIAVLHNEAFYTSVLNSIFYSAVSVALLLLIIVPAVYAMTRIRFGGSRIQSPLLVLPLLPITVLLIPLTRMLNLAGLYNTRIGMILVMTAFQIPFSCWLLKGFFEVLPRSLEDAAYIDGCSRIKCFFLIMLPNIRMGIITTIIQSFVYSWLNYLIPYALIPDRKLMSVSQMLLTFQGQYGTDLKLLTAASLLMAIPPLLLFLVFQKSFIAGMFGIESK
ncbi:MAG: carbohydrate ABC transporter permease [Lachnospiraceae bacterium]|nr:carbohydrate ABC transporter permease [Lachnospiraceae bacterium]